MGNDENTLRIAVAGTGKIVHTAFEAFAQEPRLWVAAIYARPHSQAKGEALAARYGVERVYTNYDEMLSQCNATAVYIGLVNSAHFDYARRALQAGKHVIMEKPFCSNYAQAKELAQLAKSQGLFILEAVTLLHSQGFAFAQRHLERIAPIKMVQCNYSQYSSRYDRYLQGDVAPAFDPALAGGALMDINIYNLNFVLGLLGKPRDVAYHANIGYNGIDTSGTLTLVYPSLIATCTGAKDSASPGFCIVQGEKGCIVMHGAPNSPGSVTVEAGNYTATFTPTADEHRMAGELRDFCDIILGGDTARAKRLLDISLAEMEVADAARRCAGIPILE